MSGFRWYRGVCPNCGAGYDRGRGLQAHSLSVWCADCGWGRNRKADPATGRPVAKWGLLGNPEVQP